MKTGYNPPSHVAQAQLRPNLGYTMKMDHQASVANTIEKFIVVDTLGFLIDPEHTMESVSSIPPRLSARIIADARRAGLTALNTTVGYVFGNADAYELTKHEISEWDAAISQFPNDLVKALSVRDIEKAKEDGKIAVIYGVQNSEMLGCDVDRVDEFAGAGLRIIQLTYNYLNAVGGGATDATSAGLSEFGRNVVERMNKVGVIVDISHGSRQLCLDAVSASSEPVAITHTGCRAMVDVPRNVDDAVLRAVAEQGGYVGIYFMPFLAYGRKATAADAVAHIEHAINVCGEDHVGIGTDGSCTPLRDVEAYKREFRQLISRRRELGISAPGEDPDILPWVEELYADVKFHEMHRLLKSHGHSERRIEKIFGMNFMRLAKDVWGA